jgi:hypothetical protein
MVRERKKERKKKVKELMVGSLPRRRKNEYVMLT